MSRGLSCTVWKWLQQRANHGYWRLQAHAGRAEALLSPGVKGEEAMGRNVSVGGEEERPRVITLNLNFFVNKVAHLFLFFLLAKNFLILVPPVLVLEGEEMRE